MDQIILTRAAITDFPGAKYLHVTGVNSNQNQQSVFCFGFCWGFFRGFFFFFGGWGSIVGAVA
jgi:hypothetical protein